MKKLFCNPLSEEQEARLEAIKKSPGSTDRPRQRAHAVLLSASGYALGELVEIFGACRQSVATWIKDWNSKGELGLFDAPRSGRPRKIPLADEAHVITAIKTHPRSLKKVLAKLSEELGIEVSLATLRRLCRRHKLTWKRVRRSLKDKQNEALFLASQEQLKVLRLQAQKGEIDLVYFDQSGFTTESAVPYAWHDVGDTLRVPCSKSKRLNVLGFMHLNGRQFDSFVFSDKVDSDVVIACIDEFCKGLSSATTLIMDNASIHKSDDFQAQIEGWKAKNLTIVYLSPYSPELNLIEHLWRKIKYDWLPFSAYRSFAALQSSLHDILAKIGQEYVINFEDLVVE